MATKGVDSIFIGLDFFGLGHSDESQVGKIKRGGLDRHMSMKGEGHSWKGCVRDLVWRLDLLVF
jgi:hypothetical protein